MAQVYRQLLHWTKCHFHPEADHNVDINEGEVNRSKVVDHYLNSVALRPTSRRESKKQWSLALNESGDMPDSAEQLLDDYALALNITSPNTVAMRCRIDAVLLSILATAKKEETNAREHTAPDAEDSPYLAFLPKVSMPHTIKGKRYTLECNADNILWYGDRDELDTNLLVVRKESPLDTGDYSTLAPMVMIHRAHRLAGRKTEIYGICTDSCQWNFIHINTKGRVSHLSLYWLHDQRQIIKQVRSIIRQAVVLHQKASGSSRQLRTCSELTGCKISYQSEQSDNFDVILE